MWVLVRIVWVVHLVATVDQLLEQLLLVLLLLRWHAASHFILISGETGAKTK